MAIEIRRLPKDSGAEVPASRQSDQRDATVLGQAFRSGIHRTANCRTVGNLQGIFANNAHCVHLVHRYGSCSGALQICGQVKDDYEAARHLARTGTRAQSGSVVEAVGGTGLLVLLSSMNFRITNRIFIREKSSFNLSDCHAVKDLSIACYFFFNYI